MFTIKKMFFPFVCITPRLLSLTGSRLPLFRVPADTLRRFWRLGMLRILAVIIAGAPALVSAQYSEIKMGEYLHYATAAANGGIYAGIDGIGYVGVFGTPSLYKTNTGWLDLPIAQGFDTSKQ